MKNKKAKKKVVVLHKKHFSKKQLTVKGDEEGTGTSMAGLPKVFAKMGFKKGWAAYRRAHGAKKSHATKKHHHRSHRISGDFSAPSIIRAPIRRLSQITPSKILSPVVDLALLVAGMAACATVKKIVPIKNAHVMNGAGVVVGVGGSLMTKNRFIKLPLLGVALQSTISEAKILIPNMIPLAGDDEVMYLPVNGDQEQLEYQGDDDRLATAYGTEYEDVSGDDDRLATAYGDDEVSGEGRNS
jgi:hypothetical protein